MAQLNTSGSGKGINFGLIFFSSSETPQHGDKYRLVIESTRFADQHNFSSVWIPERHFTKDGWLYPNPVVLQAALARETQQIQLRAGSVVIPLHSPLRVAEEWAMVDNLSGGRVGISFASGWHPTDFSLNPENYARRNELMYEGIETVRALWRGETVQVKSGDGKLVDVRTYPTPIQSELPFWVTAAGNPKTFARAGEIGAHLLTHMYNQSVDELAEKIRIYREARAQAGYDPATGLVSVMLHTFINKDIETVHAQAQGPFIEYLKSASYLVNAIAYSRGQKNVDLSTLSEQDLNDYLHFVYDRLISTQRVLFGTPEQCADLIVQMHNAGVDEVACQMDFGVDTDLVLSSMTYLDQLKDLANQRIREQQLARADQAITVQGEALTATPTPANNGTHPDPSTQINPLSYSLATIRQRLKDEVELSEFYQNLYQLGVQLDESFQGIKHLWRRDGESLGQVKLSATLLQDIADYYIHPTLLDACFQVLIAALPQAMLDTETALYLPTGIRSFQMHQSLSASVWSHAQITSDATHAIDMLEGTVHILNDQGQLLAEATGLQLQRTALAMSSMTSITTTPAEANHKLAPAASEAHGSDTVTQDWLYELQWEPAELTSDIQKQSNGTWIIFSDKSGVGHQITTQLEQHGAHCIRVVAGSRYQKRSSQYYQIALDRPEEVDQVIAEILQQQTVRGVIHLWSLDATPMAATSVPSLEEDQLLGVGNALNLIQALVRHGGTTPPQLWLTTRGAQAVGSGLSQLEIPQSPLWGLGKTCALEHPELWGGLIDIDPAEDATSQAAAQVLSALSNTIHEDQIAFRARQSYVARMVHSQPLESKALHLHKDASYLITGGLWGLGLEIARRFATQGAGHLILLGRSVLPPREQWPTITAKSRTAQQIAGLRELEQLGAQVHYVSVDITDEERLHSFLQGLSAQGYPPIRGIIHAASVWQDERGQSLVRPLANLTPEALKAVFGPKVIGSWLLHTLLQQQPLDFFVSFSSAASLFGSAAQGNYAAAGEFMDLLAAYRRAHGQPALSIDWGAISEIGFGATPEGIRVHEYWESRGIQRINPRQVLAALEQLTPQNIARIGVLRLDWQLLAQHYRQITQLPLVRHLVSTTAPASEQQETNVGQESSVLQAIRTANAEQRQRILEQYLAEQVSGVLRLPVERMDLHQPLTSLGLDSLMAIELKNRLEHELDIRIPIVTFLQGPSITQFASQLRNQLAETILEMPDTPADNSQVADQSLTNSISAASIIQPQDAERLLAHLDQISDQDIDKLLSQFNVEELQTQINGQSNEEHNGYAAEVNQNLSAQEAEMLLAQLDQLSDQQVDSLLKQIAQKEDFNR